MRMEYWGMCLLNTAQKYKPDVLKGDPVLSWLGFGMGDGSVGFYMRGWKSGLRGEWSGVESEGVGVGFVGGC